MGKEQAQTITIMKYLARNGSYKFIVKDKHNFPDLLDRLDYMADLKEELTDSGEMVKHLWTKETVLL